MKLLIVIFLSIVAELWVAIPYGIAVGIDPIIVFATAVAFNFAPVPLVVKLGEEFERRHGYLFRWDNLPGGDSKRVLAFLRNEFKLELPPDAKIRRSADGKTITIGEGTDSVTFTLNVEENKVDMTVREGPTRQYIPEVHKGTLNVYRSGMLRQLVKWGEELITKYLNTYRSGTLNKFVKWSEELITKYGLVGIIIGVLLLGGYSVAFAAYLLGVAQRKIFLGLFVGLLIEGSGWMLATRALISLVTLIR
jgi:uncharacterized membrane protein